MSNPPQEHIDCAERTFSLAEELPPEAQMIQATMAHALISIAMSLAEINERQDRLEKRGEKFW